jgi:hypothetical protein
MRGTCAIRQTARRLRGGCTCSGASSFGLACTSSSTIVVRNTAFTVWAWSKATARRFLRSGLRIDRGSGAEIGQPCLKNVAIQMLVAAPLRAGDEAHVELCVCCSAARFFWAPTRLIMQKTLGSMQSAAKRKQGLRWQPRGAETGD